MTSALTLSYTPENLETDGNNRPNRRAFVNRNSSDAVDILFQEAGATAIFKSNPFERRFRDVHTVSIQVQGSIARMQSAGQFYLGLTPQQLVLVP